jgi:hypothetical protein
VGHEPGRDRSATLTHEAMDDECESLGARRAGPGDSDSGFAVVIPIGCVARSGANDHYRTIPRAALSLVGAGTAAPFARPFCTKLTDYDVES